MESSEALTKCVGPPFSLWVQSLKKVTQYTVKKKLSVQREKDTDKQNKRKKAQNCINSKQLSKSVLPGG